VFDAMLKTDSIEDMRPEESPGGSLTALRRIGERHAIIGEDLMYLIRKRRDDASEEGGVLHFTGVFVKLDVGEL
jgi:hypothetical protein